MHDNTATPIDVARDRLLNRGDLRAVVPWSDTTLWRAIRAGRFPAPVQHLSTTGRRLWRAADIRAWLDGGAAA